MYCCSQNIDSRNKVLSIVRGSIVESDKSPNNIHLPEGSTAQQSTLSFCSTWSGSTVFSALRLWLLLFASYYMALYLLFKVSIEYNFKTNFFPCMRQNGECNITRAKRNLKHLSINTYMNTIYEHLD